MLPRRYAFVEILSDLGAGTYGAALAPAAMRYAAFEKGCVCFNETPTFAVIDHLNDRWTAKEGSPKARYLDVCYAIYNEIADTVRQAVANDFFPFILSGDHGNAAGVLFGLRRAFPDKRIGVVWIDAHGDLHTPYTTPSGNLHGMPLALVAQHDFVDQPTEPLDPAVVEGWNKLKALGGEKPVVRGDDMVFIGVRDLELEEWQFIRQHNTTYFDPNAVAQLGTQEIARRIDALMENVDLFYISFDIDSLDDQLVPGTGTPEPEGLSITQARHLLWHLVSHPKAAAVEFTEINPLLDRQNRTASLSVDFIESIVID